MKSWSQKSELLRRRDIGKEREGAIALAVRGPALRETGLTPVASGGTFNLGRAGGGGRSNVGAARGARGGDFVPGL